jgi:hypothetical protein
MIDRIGVARIATMVAPPRPAMKGRIIQRVDVMEREAQNLALSARQVHSALQLGKDALLSDAVLNSRNWMLSVLMSHCFLQWGLEPPLGAPGPGKHADRFWYLEGDLIPRAINAGKQDGDAVKA